MKLLNNQLKAKFLSKPAIKVIVGLHNFNINHIFKIVKSAEIGAAVYSYIDIAANPRIVSIVRSITNLPICVSSIDPVELYKCKLAGADLVEIGNFDIFYNKKIAFSKEDILKLVKSTANLVPISCICVTIPHVLYLNEQIELVNNLQKLGIGIIQTEGATTKSNISIKHQSILNSSCNAAAALSSTYTITKYIETSVITSSGINALSAPVAISYGASSIGIGSALHHYKNIYDMSNYVKEISCSISSTNNRLFRPEAWYISFVSISRVQV